VDFLKPADLPAADRAMYSETGEPKAGEKLSE
jgi:hypothetical protein